MIRRIFQPFYTAWALLTFVLSVLLAFPLFALISIGNSPKSRRAIWWIIHNWAKLWMLIIGMPLRLKGPRPAPGRYVVVANHISYIDAIAIFPAIPGYFRPLGKKEFSKIPVVGFIYKQIVLMVDRSSTHSRAKSMRLMWRALRRECNVVIFPEGTFNETGAPLKEFYDGAFRLAISAQVPILPILLPDTVNRWHYSGWWKLSPGRNRAVYLDPVQVEGYTIADIPALKEKVYKLMEAGLVASR
ncbi:lysophospholipid acyltransferase family protein [Chitinophagaceae bacterium MMS25-I14]